MMKYGVIIFNVGPSTWTIKSLAWFQMGYIILLNRRPAFAIEIYELHFVKFACQSNKKINSFNHMMQPAADNHSAEFGFVPWLLPGL